ncbi:hypothetical protein BP6252_07927 [Coleophoma cylindrospora]|uniref:DUF952 domain-containing protein n=1 Tax=Coleophoma cylindrospora TaxID=1849047 RepID=A0A3D8RBX4_9HELO|nr:hypothetical protein BP6252_07927 [Coleophoma cylindrospora]
MTSSHPPMPPYIYKILPSAPESPMPAALAASDLDRADGFIHTSTASVIPTTSRLFFSAAPALWILKLSTTALARDGARCLWEGPQGCVHVYAADAGLVSLGAANVVDVMRFVRREEEPWEEVFGKEDARAWLVDA